MKYIILQGDGMADHPLPELEGKTPLQVARTPWMDLLARRGAIGMVKTIPPGMSKGSDVANLSILGYNPSLYYTGRAPLEAASMGVELKPDEVAFRCNLVTIKAVHGSRFTDHGIMEDYSAGHISTEEARELILEIDRQLGRDGVRFYPGVSYRHLLVIRGVSEMIKCIPPHDFSGKLVAHYLPQGNGAGVLLDLMEQAYRILHHHPINRARHEQGLPPANAVWFWGQGRAPSMPSFQEKYGLSGAMISAVDLMKGLGRYAGFEVPHVPGATGYLDTNYTGKVEAFLKALARHGLVFLHVEAPDEAGHNGDLKAKIQALEDFDSKVVGPVLAGLRDFPEHRILLLCDHPTPITLRTHTDEEVPFVIYPAEKGRGAICYSEWAGRSSGLRLNEGFKLMDYFLSSEPGAHL